MIQTLRLFAIAAGAHDHVPLWMNDRRNHRGHLPAGFRLIGQFIRLQKSAESQAVILFRPKQVHQSLVESRKGEPVMCWGDSRIGNMIFAAAQSVAAVLGSPLIQKLREREAT